MSFDRWKPACNEYFENYAGGIYDEEAYLQLILPRDKLEIDDERGDLIVGHAGIDGIYFCFREGRGGIWSYYGIDHEHVLKATTLKDLVDGWKDGTLKV